MTVSLKYLEFFKVGSDFSGFSNYLLNPGLLSENPDSAVFI